MRPSRPRTRPENAVRLGKMGTTISLRRRGGESRRETFRGDGVITLGRSPDNDVMLLCPRVSKRHATAQVKGGLLWLRDLSSMNGTFVNGVATREAIVVKPGDIVQIGDFTLTFEVGRTVPMPSLPADEDEPTSAGMESPVVDAARTVKERELAESLVRRLAIDGLSRESMLRVIDAMVDVVAAGTREKPRDNH